MPSSASRLTQGSGVPERFRTPKPGMEDSVEALSPSPALVPDRELGGEEASPASSSADTSSPSMGKSREIWPVCVLT